MDLVLMFFEATCKALSSQPCTTCILVPNELRKLGRDSLRCLLRQRQFFLLGKNGANSPSSLLPWLNPVSWVGCCLHTSYSLGHPTE